MVVRDIVRVIQYSVLVYSGTVVGTVAIQTHDLDLGVAGQRCRRGNRIKYPNHLFFNSHTLWSTSLEHA